jgi:hypothetical protein
MATLQPGQGEADMNWLPGGPAGDAGPLDLDGLQVRRLSRRVYCSHVPIRADYVLHYVLSAAQAHHDPLPLPSSWCSPTLGRLRLAH